MNRTIICILTRYSILKTFESSNHEVRQFLQGIPFLLYRSMNYITIMKMFRQHHEWSF